MLNEPGPIDQPEMFPDFAGNTLPLEQFRLPMGWGRLIPARMEDTYVTTLTRRGRGWQSQRGTMTSPPSYADRGVVPIAAMMMGRGKEVPGTCGGAHPRARPAAICGDHPTRPDLVGPESPQTPQQYRAPDPKEREGRTPTLTEELGAVRRGLERVAQQYAPLEKWKYDLEVGNATPGQMVAGSQCPWSVGPGLPLQRDFGKSHPKYSMAGLL